MIAIITGGTGFEREVSLKSAAAVQTWIPESRIYTLPEDLDQLIQDRSQIAVGVPVIHGKGGEDGSIQGFLEQLGIPYLFSPIKTHALALDKSIAKQVASLHGLRVAKAFTHVDSISVPVVIKPKSGGSSEATYFCNTKEEVTTHLEKHPEIEFLIEEALPGREFTVGVLEIDGELKAMEVVEVITATGMFDYNSKYNAEELAQEVCPADISETLKKELQDSAVRMHKALDARHLTRTDFRLNAEGDPVFLETNTIPGMTTTSFIPNFVSKSECTMQELFTYWIKTVR